MQFPALFQSGLFFQMHYIFLIFVARWRHKFREIAVKNCEKSKNGLRKDTVANYASIWTLFTPRIKGLDALCKVLNIPHFRR